MYDIRICIRTDSYYTKMIKIKLLYRINALSICKIKKEEEGIYWNKPFDGEKSALVSVNQQINVFRYEIQLEC